MLTDAAAVFGDLGGVRVLLARHVAGLFEQGKVDERCGVALRTGIPIPIPGAPEIAALLDDPYVGDAGLLQPGARDQPGEAAADEGHLDLVGQRRSGFGLRVRVVEEVGELADRLDVLVVSVLPESLVAFGRVLAQQRLPVELDGGSPKRHPDSLTDSSPRLATMFVGARHRRTLSAGSRAQVRRRRRAP